MTSAIRVFATATLVLLSASMLFAQTSHNITDVFETIPTKHIVDKAIVTPSPQPPPPAPVFDSNTAAIESALSSAADDAEYIIPETNDSCLLYTSPSPRDLSTSRMPSSA